MNFFDINLNTYQDRLAPQHANDSPIKSAALQTTCMSKIINLTFLINKHCEFGKAIYICGSSQEFGNWDIHHAIKLKWEKNNYWVLELPFHIDEYDKRVNIFYHRPKAPGQFLDPTIENSLKLNKISHP